MDKEKLFEIDEDTLLVANGGRPFTRNGVISICASHLSDKKSGGVIDHFEAGDEQLVRAIRSTELGHYKDPNRLTSDFNDEREIVHDYGGRFVWELLQNADDAMGEERTSDVLIGSKGLGFKAVLEITDEPEIHSGPFHFLFSATRTQNLLKEKIPGCNPPPLMFRIPHECKPDSRVRELLAAGYTTVVCLPFRDKGMGSQVIDRLRDLDPLFLLLSQELSCVRIRVPEGETVHKIKRSEPGLSSGNAKLFTQGPSGSSCSSWRRWIRNRPPPSEEDKQLTVAVCLPLTEEGAAVPHAEFVPFHDFFPTEEESGACALVHASFDLEHNRKRVRKGDYDEDILQEFGELFQDVLDEIPARTALEAFGKIESDGGNTPLKTLQGRISKILRETSFVPVIGGDQVRPSEVRLWQDRLGLVLRDNEEQVQTACLLVTELADLANILEDFDAQKIDLEEYFRLLRYCRNDSIDECFESWRVLAEIGLERVSRESQGYPERRRRYLRKLQKVPCWWTEAGAARALDGAQPLLFTRHEDWPDWLPVDSLHPRMSKALKRWEARAKKQDKSEILEIWSGLISGRVLSQREEYLHGVLLPFVEKWDDERWEADGWMVLRQVLAWTGNRKFESMAPWIEDRDGNQEESRRARTARELCLPTDKGWLPAAYCYAGKDWDGPPSFDEFFASVKHRGLVLSFQRWPNQVRKWTKKHQWKALLRWAGVSWEPKVQRVTSLPHHCLVLNYEKDSVHKYYEWLCDWEIEFFPECIHFTYNDVVPAKVFRTMVPLAKALEGYSARYYRTRYYYNKKEKQRIHGNFAVYQLRHEEWLPCKEALLHNHRKAAPKQAFLPGKGLGGLLPEVDRNGLADEEWFREIMPGLRTLGVREELPDDPKDWHKWMRQLPILAEQLEESERKVPEGGEKAGGLYRAADALYRGYLKLERESEFPDDIDIPCLNWENDRKTLIFSPPREVYHVDEPHFDEVRGDILRNDYKLFIVRLGAGNNAQERLGVRLLSDVMSAESRFDVQSEPESCKLLQRYRERRQGLSIVASLRNPLPGELSIMAVNGLELQLHANGKSVTGVQVLSWRREDGVLLINLDKDKWRALGHALAARVAHGEEKASLFENLLRESDKEGYLDRLRQEGVTEDDIKEAGDAWLLGQSQEQNMGSDVPVAQKLQQVHTRSAETIQVVVPSSPDLQEESQQTSRTETGGGGEPQPPGTSQKSERYEGGNNGQRPRPETGLAAEYWLHEKLKGVFDQVEWHERDKENRESDFVVSSGDRKFHIEVKHVENQSGTFYWSGLQCEKARDLEREDGQYYMAILSPNGDEAYEIGWIWHPLDELQKASRDIQWEGNSGYEPVFTDSWEIQTQRPNTVPTKRYRFRIRLKDDVFEEFERDTETLEALRRQIDRVTG